MIALLVVAALVVGGIVTAAVVMGAGSTELTLRIDTCEIAADGTLTATGTINSSAATDVDVEVTFTDLAGGDVVDTGQQTLTVPEDAAQRWQVTGTAGDDVQRVTCDVTADD